MRLTLLLSALAFLSAACDPAPLSRAPEVDDWALGPIAFDRHLVLGSPEDEHLTFIHLADGQVEEIAQHELGYRPNLLLKTPKDSQVERLIALGSEDAILSVINPTSGAREDLALGSQFEDLLLSNDGQLALAYFPPNASRAVFHNDHEVAFIDLGAIPAADAIQYRILPSLGGSPRFIRLAPTFNGSNFAFAASDDHIAIVDLDHPERPERSIPLRSPASQGLRQPSEISFGLTDDALWALIETTSTSSTFLLKLTDEDPEKAPLVQISQLATTHREDRSTFLTIGADEGALHTLTLSPQSRSLTLQNLETHTEHSIQLGARVNAIEIFGDSEAPQAILWGRNADHGQFYIVDLKALSRGQSRPFRQSRSSSALNALYPLDGARHFLALHPSSNRGVSIIDIETDRIMSFGKTGEVKDILFPEGDDSYAFALTRLSSRDYLVTLNLRNFQTEVSEIPDRTERLLLLEDAQTLIAVSKLKAGRLALWPSDAPTDEALTVLEGFFLHNLLSR